MGVKNLWTILAPFCERKPLYELQGKRVAIDLSCWVCEAQNVTEYTVQPRMYLRNLYFRTCYLLLMEVSLVFVLEGKAPELKYKTIAARNALQFKGAKPKKDGAKLGKDRSRFNHTLKQCEEMLKLMGLACIKGEGEAEALCAYLNEDGLVDGIISQDSDCFAYGARIVYRNFSISQQGNHAAKGGSVDVYDIEKANRGLNFGRNKIIALALLCGSDYSNGVYGIGKDSVIKLFNNLSDDEVLNRLRSWRGKDELYDELEAKIANKNVCMSCGHDGKVQLHTKRGCQHCETSQGCGSAEYKTERLAIKNELNMRTKALIDLEFPDENLIKEFLTKKSQVSRLNLKWEKPDLINFIKFTLKYLSWEEIYSFEKIFPILTRWQLLHPQGRLEKGTVNPKSIKKRRCPKGVPSYEVIWEDKEGQFVDLIPAAQLVEFGDCEKLWSTIEPQNLVEKAYPNLVQTFEESKKPKSRRKKNAVEEIDDLMNNISISKPVAKKRAKQRTLDNFVKAADCSFDLNQSNFGDEDDLDVSDIVDGIIKQVPSYIPENLEQLGLKRTKQQADCSFFITEFIEDDLFEKTFKEYCDDSEGSDTDLNTVDSY